MRIVVRVHDAVRPVFEQWRETLGATSAERHRRARELWNEFVPKIVAAGGPPQGASEDTTTRPPTHWCGFPGGGFAQLVVRPDRRVSLFATEREVVVVRLVFSPGLGD